MSIRKTAWFVTAFLGAALLGACSSSKTSKSGPVYAEVSSPVVRAKLEARVENIKYQRGVVLVTNLERIAAYGEAAIPVCLKGLKTDEPMVRMGCIWVLGRVGDRRVIPELETALKDDVDYVRFESASALGSMGSKAGYSVLVSGLENDRVDFRYRCLEALKEFTGHDHGFSHNGSPEQRAAGVKRWNDWLDRVGTENM
ncbi:MAG: HEAT repeat domain-containing protein [Planctomycetota bacterium]